MLKYNALTDLRRKIEDVKANSASIVNIRVVNRSVKGHNRRLKRVPSTKYM